MKKLSAILLILFLSLGIASSSFGAADKKAKPAKKIIPPQPIVETVSTPEVLPSQSLVAQNPTEKRGWFVEGGLSGGGGLFELGYGKTLASGWRLSGGAGYAVGNQYGVVVLDPIRASFNVRGFSIGAGINYAMYSVLVADIPGLSGTLPSQNIFGFEVFAGKSFGRYNARFGYSTALGLRAGIGLDF